MACSPAASVQPTPLCGPASLSPGRGQGSRSDQTLYRDRDTAADQGRGLDGHFTQVGSAEEGDRTRPAPDVTMTHASFSPMPNMGPMP